MEIFKNMVLKNKKKLEKAPYLHKALKSLGMRKKIQKVGLLLAVVGLTSVGLGVNIVFTFMLWMTNYNSMHDFWRAFIEFGVYWFLILGILAFFMKKILDCLFERAEMLIIPILTIAVAIGPLYAASSHYHRLNKIMANRIIH